MLWACRRLKLPHVARFILIGIYTGTRQNAILRMQWQASLSGGHTDLARGVMFRRGSAESETSKRRPPVHIPQKLLSRLLRWQEADISEFPTSRLPTLVHSKGNAVAKINYAFRQVVKAADLGKDVTPHTLRHTCASWLLWEGRTVWDVAGVIGASASVVESTYGHHRRIEEERKRA